MNGHEGAARIGNRRSRCRTCNNFAQNVRRIATSRLMQEHRDEYERLRVQAEMDLYPQVIEEWRA